MTEKEEWHLDKRVPITLIIAIVANMLGASWMVSKLDSRVSNLEESRKVDSAIVAEIVKSQNTTNVSLAKIETNQNYTVQALKDITARLGR